MLRASVVLMLACGYVAAQPPRGDTPENFKKHIEPLVAGLGKAKGPMLLEGLPHQTFERELLAKELKAKKTAKIGGFPFYEGEIAPGAEDARKLAALCKDAKSYRRFSGEKRCGGFHPDWCLVFKDGDDVYRVLICFGCTEAKIIGPKNELRTDLGDEALKTLKAVLVPLRTNRPKAEKP